MRIRPGPLLVFLVGFFTVACGWRLQSPADQVQACEQAGELVPVVVAARDLYMGLPLVAEDVELRELPRVAVPAGGEVFHDISQVVGRTPRERVLTNEILRDERLASADAGVGLNAIISPGKRAVSFPIEPWQAYDGLLQTGNFVDVYASRSGRPGDDGTPRVESCVLAEELKVLAIGGLLRPPTGKKAKSDPPPLTSVTVEATPEEALAIDGARNGDGTVGFALRSDIDILAVDELERCGRGVTSEEASAPDATPEAAMPQ